MKQALLAVIVLVLSATAASAQEAPAREEAPSGAQPVFVLMNTGEEIQGHMLQLGPASLTMLLEGVRRDLPLDSVLRIDAPGDSVKKTAIVAGIVGVAWAALMFSQQLDAADVIPAALANGVFFGLAAAGIDALHVGRTVIYRRPVAPVPAASRAARATLFTLRF